MIQSVIDPTSPERTIENAHGLVKGLVRMAGYAAGLNGMDLDALGQTGVPRWVFALGGAAAGAVLFARYAPEHWVATVRSYRLSR